MSAREDLTERSAEGFAERCRAGRIREESITVWRFLPLSAFEVPADFCALLLNRARKWFLRFRPSHSGFLNATCIETRTGHLFPLLGSGVFPQSMRHDPSRHALPKLQLQSPAALSRQFELVVQTQTNPSRLVCNQSSSCKRVNPAQSQIIAFIPHCVAGMPRNRPHPSLTVQPSGSSLSMGPGRERGLPISYRPAIPRVRSKRRSLVFRMLLLGSTSLFWQIGAARIISPIAVYENRSPDNNPGKMTAHEQTRHHRFEFRSSDVENDRKGRANTIAPEAPFALSVSHASHQVFLPRAQCHRRATDNLVPIR